jgi:hypothetical protein
MNEISEPKRKRERSPNYPAISLGPAVEKAKDLYKAEKSYLAPIDTILKHWGYRPKSGAGLVAVAALLKFGLLEDEGSGPARKAKITELGQRIIRDTREESPDREQLLRDAALRPQIHHELWARFGASLPSDSNLHHTLIFEYAFTDGGANEFIRQFKETITFARLNDETEDDMTETSSLPAVIGYAQPVSQPRRVVETVSTYGPTPGGRALSIPISGSDQWPTLYLPSRISEADWTQMIAVLQAMKPGIVATEAVAGTAQGTGRAYDPTVEITNGEKDDAPE